MGRTGHTSAKQQGAGGALVKATSGAKARAASQPYYNPNLAPVDSKSDWAMGVAHAHASDKAAYEGRIEMLNMQLAAVGVALAKHAGQGAVDKAKREGAANYDMTQSIKGSSQPADELADYGDAVEPAVEPAGKPGRAARERGVGGRPAGFAANNAYILFVMDFQKEVKEDEALRKVMMDRYKWDGLAWSQGGKKGESIVTIMHVQSGEWARLKAATDDASKARADKYNEQAAAIKKEVNAAFEKYKELLRTDPDKAAAFQKERAEKLKESDAVAA